MERRTVHVEDVLATGERGQPRAQQLGSFRMTLLVLRVPYAGMGAAGPAPSPGNG